MIKRSFNHKDTIILNVFAPNHRASKYMKIQWIGLKGETDKFIIIF